MYEKGSTSASLGGLLELRGPIPFDRSSPDEDPSLLFLLRPRVHAGDHVSLYAEFRGGYDGRAQDPRNEGLYLGWDRIYPGKDRYVEFSEAYLNVYVADADIRIGIQKFAWGTLDQINPTDNLNPWDLRQPFTLEPLERKVGVPAVRLMYGNAFATALLEAVWIPFYVPYRLPDPGDRWYPPLFRAPTTFHLGFLGPGLSLPPLRVIQVNEEGELPARDLSESEFGIRIARTFGSVDLGLSYFKGYDRRPVFAAEGRVGAALAFFPPGLDLTYLLRLKPQFHRMQSFGFEMAAAWGSVTVRAEGAYIKDRFINVGLDAIPVIAGQFRPPDPSEIDVAPRPDGLTVSFPFNPTIAFSKDLISAGAGFDYQWGNHVFTVQAVTDAMLNYDGEPLIYEEVELNLVLGVSSRFLEDTLVCEGGLLVNPMEAAWVLTGSAVYSVSDSVTLGARLIVLDGRPETPLGQYRRNDEIEFFARYSF